MNSFITPRIVYRKKGKYFQYIVEKNYIDYFKKFGISLVPLVYNKPLIDKIFKAKIKLIIFSGGNDLYTKTKNRENKLRDQFEKYLLKKCIDNKVPIIAICRGFQFINYSFKGNLVRTNDHVKRNHKIYLKNKILNVNSFHRYKITKLNNQFNILGTHNDKSIEYAISDNFKILCLMFHPERKNKSQNEINKIIKTFLKSI
jgi:putative glutamine amidotransferase